MQKRLVAKVYVDKVVYHIDDQFDYLIPEMFIDSIKIGCRVMVPFGKGNKKVQGLVVDIIENADFEGQLKPIATLLDSEPVITKEMFSLIDFMVKNTFCTYYDAVKTILPTGTNVDAIETYSLNCSIESLDMSLFSETEQNLIEFLRKAKTQKELNSFLDITKNPSKKAVVKSLLDKNIIKIEDTYQKKVKSKTVKMVRIAEGFEPENIKLTQKQKEVIGTLNDIGVAMVKELAYFCGVTESVIKNLQKKHILEYFEREVEVEATKEITIEEKLDDIILSNNQAKVYEGILELVNSNSPKAALLHGVTGSGKTQVYIKLIEAVLNMNKTAMMLVPEIALTTQLVDRFISLFGNKVGVIHSNLSVAERMDEIKRVKNGEVKIIIGTRSAVFAPLQNIGIIILDEEGEASYKSDTSPRYHARDIAKFRCVQNNAALLLGSATPSIDSYYQALKGKYSLFTLDERFSNATLPDVYLIDMKAEQENKNLSPLSEILVNQLKINLEKKEQSILLINRRGYHTYATCMACGEVIKCNACDVPMTYHKANGYLMCHYCGHTEKFVSNCKSCGSQYIKLTGIGTQRLEDELISLFPQARILRMDTDTTYSKYSYEKNFDAFKNGKYDILLGTQMIAKGLDFPNVTLVGVLNADSGLNSADYKASERVFSLITQVVGRSGRSEKKGRAYIQTFNPSNPVINFAANQDYQSFYEDEIFSRKALTYPPFCDIIMLMFSGTNEDMVQNAAKRSIDILKEEAKKANHIALKVLGVTPASIYKISNKFRYRVIIKCKLNNSLRKVISNTLKRCPQEKDFRGITCFADINGNVY